MSLLFLDAFIAWLETHRIKRIPALASTPALQLNASVEASFIILLQECKTRVAPGRSCRAHCTAPFDQYRRFVPSNEMQSLLPFGVF
jgi:hypothetical protein